eukprot:scaffold26486_cov21-Tisochrysis_lutea.AAC.1
MSMVVHVKQEEKRRWETLAFLGMLQGGLFSPFVCFILLSSRGLRTGALREERERGSCEAELRVVLMGHRI